MKRQQGFGIVQILLIIVIIGMIGGTGWYVWNNRNIQTSINSSTQEKAGSPEASEINEYKRETSPPDSWKKYTSDKFGISFYYPSDMFEVSVTTLTKSDDESLGNVFSDNATVSHQFCFRPKNEQWCPHIISISDQSLSDTAEQFQTYLKESDMTPFSTEITFNGFRAFDIYGKDSSGGVNNKSIFIEANNYTYVLPEDNHQEGDGYLGQQGLTQLIDSIQIQQL